MNRVKKMTLTPFLFAVFIAVSAFAAEVQKPNVAGSFYPEDPRELSLMIEDFLSKANPEPVSGQIFALISPHAGYPYSGKTAAFGYKLIKNKPYKTAVVIGTSHRFGFRGVSVYPAGAFRTPLGDITIDAELAAALLSTGDGISFEPRAFQKEHSVEVQLPFLQKVLSDFKIVPVVMGDCDLPICETFARALTKAVGGRTDVLIVVSTDMYHGYDWEEAEIIDGVTMSYLTMMDANGLYAGLRSGTAQLCGGFPAVSTLIAAKESGHRMLKVLHYTTSAKETNRKIKGDWTVGYTSCVIDRQEGDGQMFDKNQKKRLLEIARSSIETYLATGKKLEVKETDPLLLKEMGAFVTLHQRGQLRGCIGNLIGSQPLYLTIRDMAVESATEDPRFPPVELSELEDIEIEISALSPLELVDSADKIQMGRHGVLVKKGFRSGVYLPQVATETGWSKEEFLSSLCAQKAGLAPDAWKDSSTEIYIFTAEVFSEKDL